MKRQETKEIQYTICQNCRQSANYQTQQPVRDKTFEHSFDREVPFNNRNQSNEHFNMSPRSHHSGETLVTQITESNDMPFTEAQVELANNLIMDKADELRVFDFEKLRPETPARSSRKSVMRVKNLQTPKKSISEIEKQHLETLSILADENNEMKERIQE